MIDPLIKTLHTVHLVESDIDEEDSHAHLQYNYLNNYLYYKYSAPDVYTFDEIDKMSSEFCLFFGKVKDKNNQYIHSPIPLFTFRYLMLEDGSYSSYYAVKKKEGYVVEGFSWSNGLTYQVRQDVKTINGEYVTPFEIYQRILYVDHITKTLHNYP